MLEKKYDSQTSCILLHYTAQLCKRSCQYQWASELWVVAAYQRQLVEEAYHTDPSYPHFPLLFLQSTCTFPLQLVLRSRLEYWNTTAKCHTAYYLCTRQLLEAVYARVHKSPLSITCALATGNSWAASHCFAADLSAALPAESTVSDVGSRWGRRGDSREHRRDTPCLQLAWYENHSFSLSISPIS